MVGSRRIPIVSDRCGRRRSKNGPSDLCRAPREAWSEVWEDRKPVSITAGAGRTNRARLRLAYAPSELRGKGSATTLARELPDRR